jgi:hypothetical protein
MEPWKEETSLYTIIKEHIDKKGFFDPELIRDRTFVENYPTLFREPGSMDVFLSDIEQPTQEEVGAPILAALEAYGQQPNRAMATNLYYGLAMTPFVLYNDFLVDVMSTRPIPQPLWELCRTWLHEAFAPEPLKLAITIAGLHLLNEDNLNKATAIKNDLLLLSRCEEFTGYVIYALELEHMLEEQDLWDIMTHTKRWGRVSAMETFNFTTPEEKHWLLLNGWDLDIDYPAVSLLILKKSNLLDLLDERQVTDEDFNGIAHTVVDYVDFLINFEAKSPEISNEVAHQMPVIQLFNLLQKFLELARTHHKTLEQNANLMTLSQELQSMADMSNWDYLSMNQCHLLLGTLESMIMETDWVHVLPKKIVKKDGSINLLTLNMAYILNIDLHPQVWALLKKAPLCTELYPYLLSTDNKQRLNRVLAFAEKHISEYLQDEHLIMPLLTGLSDRPGYGEKILAESLTSLDEGARASAINILESWPDKNWSVDLQIALLKAQKMTQQPFLQLRINELIHHRTLSMEDFATSFRNQFK